jgi:CxxC-x17-CxxC domain-containing protein
VDLPSCATGNLPEKADLSLRELAAEAEKAGSDPGRWPKFINLNTESLSQIPQWAVQLPHKEYQTETFMAGDMQLTCSDCGQDFTFTAADQAFFSERGFSTPKRCKSCRQAKKADQGGGGGGGYRSAPAQGTPVICSGCGQPTTVPFEPRGDRPVYCRDCYSARKGGSGGRGR